MRPRAIAGGVFASATVLIVGWQIGANEAAATAALSTSASSSTGTPSAAATPTASSSAKASARATPSASATPSPSATAKAKSGRSAISGTFAGSTIETRYGPMQVEIVVSAGKITDVKALQLTDQGGRSVEISNQAAPILRTEALSAQSANIQSVSGATYTSQGYIQSLQSALDKAGL